MLIGESNETLKCSWELNAELTPFLQKKSQPFARWLVAAHAFLTPPVEQRSQQTLSAQWSSFHWMVEVLQSENLTDHGYCLFLRTDSWDPMSRANVHRCSPKHWTSCVHWLIFRGWSFNPVVYPQRRKQQKVSGNQTCCDNNRSNYFKHLSGFVLRGQVTRQTLNWLPVRQERESAFLDSAQWSLQKPWDGGLVDS